MTFQEEIQLLIEENLDIYRQSQDRLVADYNREQELIKEYNGRQLLELLQNADDAQSTEVLIKWQASSHTLTIANKGEPFFDRRH